jgi:hypothetical protein
MITYAERACFSRLHLWALRCADECTARVPDYWGNELRCHELARAVQVVVNEAHRRWSQALASSDEQVVAVVDGHCGSVEHSWLCFMDGVILDVYVPGRLPATQLVDPIVGLMYRPEAARHDIEQRIVDKLVAEMRG